MPEPISYDLFAKRGVEGFSNTYPTDSPSRMGDNLDSNYSLLRNYTEDKVADDTRVSDPNGYGYVASLPEARSQDVLDIQQQENALFALGAVAGVSLIVVGILITSSSQPSTST